MIKKFLTTHNASSNGLWRYVHNTGWVFLGKFANMAVGFFSTLYIARSLGPTNFGELSYSLSFIALFSFIASLGIDSILYRELITKPDKKDTLLGTALRIKCIAGGLTALITITTAWLLSPPDVSLLIITVLSSTFILQIFGVISFEFGAAVNNKPISLLSFTVTLIINGLKILAIALGNGVLYLALIIVIETLLYALGYIYLRNRTYGPLRNWRYDRATARQLIFDSWPFIFTSAFAVVYSRIDQVMLKHFVDATTVGIYDAAVRLTEMWYFIPSIIVGTIFPAIVNAKYSSHSAYRSRLISLAIVLIIITSLITIIISFFAKPIVLLIFGSAFIGTDTILHWYAWTLIPMTLSIVAQHFFLAENNRRLLFLLSSSGMIINVILNYIMIPQYQAWGAALATLISSAGAVLITLLMYLFTKKMRYNRQIL